MTCRLLEMRIKIVTILILIYFGSFTLSSWAISREVEVKLRNFICFFRICSQHFWNLFFNFFHFALFFYQFYPIHTRSILLHPPSTMGFSKFRHNIVWYLINRKPGKRSKVSEKRKLRRASKLNFFSISISIALLSFEHFCN